MPSRSDWKRLWLPSFRYWILIRYQSCHPQLNNFNKGSRDKNQRKERGRYSQSQHSKLHGAGRVFTFLAPRFRVSGCEVSFLSRLLLTWKECIGEASLRQRNEIQQQADRRDKRTRCDQEAISLEPWHHINCRALLVGLQNWEVW